MKRLLSILLIMITLLAPSTSFADDVNVIVNGNELKTDQSATIVDGRTLVPLRAIFEALGADVNWDEGTRSVEAKKRYSTITLQIGSKAIYINQIRNEIDVSAMLINDRTMVPARAVSEALGATVEWDEATRTVRITGDISTVEVKDNYLKGEIKADDGTVVLKYFCAYPEVLNGDLSKNSEYADAAREFVNYAEKEAADAALKDYEVSKQNGFLFFPHEMERRFDVKSTEGGVYTFEFKEEIFNGIERKVNIN